METKQDFDTGALNLRWSLALLDGLIEGGLGHLVLSPGSRSTPVVLAARQRKALQLTPILDERSAAFFALGLARARGEPVALLATSGSAPAHWYPAVIEAAHWGLPLVLLSADRPPLLRHSSANQTIDQTRLFGAFVREFHDPGLPQADASSLQMMHLLGRRVALQSCGAQPGPVHLNLPFAEPLVPRAQTLTPEAQCAPSLPVRSAPALLQAHFPPGRGLMVCGPGSAANAQQAQALRACAAQLGLPLLADPLSGVRFTPQDDAAPQSPISRHYDALLRQPEWANRLKPDWILRLGLAPVSKVLGQWLAGVPSWLVSSGGRWCDPDQGARRLIVATPEQLLTMASPRPADPQWLASWQRAEQTLTTFATAYVRHAPWCEAQLIQHLLAVIPANEGVLCANSLPIRQLDTWSYVRHTPLQVFGNRGVSGIDGQLSTLAGLNAAGVPTWGLCGDLSFCHDLSGLLLTTKLQRPLIVINNGGGRIFDYLPQRELADVVRYWRTPVTPDLAALAAPFGFAHQRVNNAATFAAALAAPPRPRLIEVNIDAERSRAMHLDFWHRVATELLL